MVANVIRKQEPYHFYINELKLRDKIYCTNGMHLNLYPIIEILEAMSEM